MSSYKRPGVFVEESLRTRNPESTSNESIAVFVASHGQGPEDVHLVRSFSDFSRVYGGFPSRTSLLPYAVYSFFNNGGREAVVLRVVGDTAALAEVTFDDRDATTPLPTLTFEAVNVGEWAHKTSIGIRDIDDDTFEVLIYRGGTQSRDIVERYTDLSMDPDASNYVVSKINSVLSGSSYVTAINEESNNLGTIGFAGTRPEETVTPVALAGGANGEEPTAVQMTDTLDKLEAVNRTYVLNFPGIHDSAIISAALSHISEEGTGFLVIDPPPSLDAAGVATYAATLPTSSYGGLFYPYLHVSDAGSNTQGATTMIPPGGSIAGVIASVDASRGVWKAPAGLDTRVAGVVGTENRLSSHDLDILTEAHVNGIRHIPGSGFVVWGSRTLKRSSADKFVPIRRTMIHLKRTLRENIQWAVFEPNDEVLWALLEESVSNYLTRFWSSGGLRGGTPDEAFFVKSDASINTLDQIESGIVNVEIGVALQYPAEFVIIKLSQWEGGASVTEG